MTFSKEWDERYRHGTHMSVWPWADLVSLVKQHCRPSEGVRVLELGCGAGANIPFFRAIGADYCAVDGSNTIVGHLRERFPDLASRIVAADFTRELPFEPGFDLVADRAALTCNCGSAIEAGLGLVWDALKPGGLLIGVDWYSTKHSDYARGEPDEDAFTRTSYDSGSFADTGRVHFSDEAHLKELLSRFDLIYMEEKVTRCVVPKDDGQLATWNFVARKPSA